MSPASHRRSPRRGIENEPEAIGVVLEALSGGRPLAAGLAVGRLSLAWEDVVGQRLALECRPASLDGGVLTVRASSAAWGAQIRFLEGEIRARANAVLGGAQSVGTVRVTIEDGAGRGDLRGSR